jgi:hypothetical protein
LGKQEVLTRIESSLRWLDAGPTDKFVRRLNQTTQQSDDSIRVSTSCLPTLAKELVSRTGVKPMTRFASAPRAYRCRPENLSGGPASSQGSDDSIRGSTSRLPKPRKHVPVLPASSQRSDDMIRVSTSCLPMPAETLIRRTGTEPEK